MGGLDQVSGPEHEFWSLCDLSSIDGFCHWTTVVLRGPGSRVYHPDEELPEAMLIGLRGARFVAGIETAVGESIPPDLASALVSVRNWYDVALVKRSHRD